MDDAPGDLGSEADKDRELAELLQRGLDQDLTELSSEDLPDMRGVYEFWEKSFGTKVRQWRQARNWSQEDLADQLRLQGFDMHQTTVAKIERGTRPLRVAEAAAIANIFRVPPLAVFMGRPPEKLPWSMQQMHETLELAEQSLAAMKEQMEASARHYIQQQAAVYDLADVLNRAALNAENNKGNEPQGDKQGKSDVTEA
jgi:transcriptional regulator with XRE-family HTH domain